MLIRVLGSAAGGGVPQWNSNSNACRLARAGDPRSPHRTQTSLAISEDGEAWFLLNASPDLRRQVCDAPALYPQSGKRSSPIEGVLLCGAEIDAIAGLLTLREGHVFKIYATGPVLQILRSNPIFDALDGDRVSRRTVTLGERVLLERSNGTASGLSATVFPTVGKMPLFLERGQPAEALSVETSVGVVVSDGTRQIVFVPGCAAVDDVLLAWVANADVLFFDGTVWTDDEMPAAGLGTRTGRDMGHMAVSGEDGAIARLRSCGAQRKVFIHVNNSNPMLIDKTPERRFCETSGWEVATDGMEIVL